jgi:hypothetical protein
MDQSITVGRPRGLDRTRQGTFLAAELAPWMITMKEGFSDTRLSDHFMSPMPGDALGSIAPDDESLLRVNDTKPCWQAVQWRATDFGIVNKGHASAQSNCR